MNIRKAALETKSLLEKYTTNPYTWNYSTLYYFCHAIICKCCPTEWSVVDDFFHLTVPTGVELFKMNNTVLERLGVPQTSALYAILYILRKSIPKQTKIHTPRTHEETCQILRCTEHPITWDYQTVHKYVRERFADPEITACVYDSMANGVTIGTITHPTELESYPTTIEQQHAMSGMLYDWYY